MTSQQTIDLIIQSIETKTPITAIYDGHLRILCPHVMGHKNNVLNVLAYQSGGESSSGLVALGSGHIRNWRCMQVAKLQDVSLTSADWATADNHSAPSQCVDQIVAQVKF